MYSIVLENAKSRSKTWTPSVQAATGFGVRLSEIPAFRIPFPDNFAAIPNPERVVFAPEMNPEP